MTQTTTHPRLRIFDGWLFAPTVEVAYGPRPDTLELRIVGRSIDRAISLALLARAIVSEHGCQVIATVDHAECERPHSIHTVDHAEAALAALADEGYQITWGAAYGREASE
jgi:hypothetical protein